MLEHIQKLSKYKPSESRSRKAGKAVIECWNQGIIQNGVKTELLMFHEVNKNDSTLIKYLARHCLYSKAFSAVNKQLKTKLRQILTC